MVASQQCVLTGVIAAFLAGVPAAAVTQASPIERVFNESLSQASSCGTALNRTVSGGARCLFGRGVDLFLDEALEQAKRLADEYGKQTFGRHFQVIGNLSNSPVSDVTELGSAIGGDIDVVIPFAGGGSMFE